MTCLLIESVSNRASKKWREEEKGREREEGRREEKEVIIGKGNKSLTGWVGVELGQASHFIVQACDLSITTHLKL